MQMLSLIFDNQTGRAVGRGQYNHSVELQPYEKECTVEQYENWKEYHLVDEDIVHAPIVADMARVRSELKARVDAAAEVERLKYITPGDGQAMTYQQKVTEAQALKAASNPQASDYPLLSSEVGITAETLSDVADIVLAAFAMWQQIGAAIESIRLGAKRDIDTAADEATARAIVDAIEWPQPAL
ncbi:hypothetical protein [Brucella tritici]|uniref:DUF4376 domain-containing protein n=1 Tax=Brucella tritici TaxID=94626 RepID=A0A6L3YDK9_9HYPH|nr:hypothetical protein [Brucella tritici]KAB2679840.1 hypothetical protein F9L08_22175 [Brucella tritici]